MLILLDQHFQGLGTFASDGELFAFLQQELKKLSNREKLDWLCLRLRFQEVPFHGDTPASPLVWKKPQEILYMATGDANNPIVAFVTPKSDFVKASRYWNQAFCQAHGYMVVEEFDPHEPSGSPMTGRAKHPGEGRVIKLFSEASQLLGTFDSSYKLFSHLRSLWKNTEDGQDKENWRIATYSHKTLGENLGNFRDARFAEMAKKACEREENLIVMCTGDANAPDYFLESELDMGELWVRWSYAYCEAHGLRVALE